MANKGKYYMTTAIAYTSGKPHIGNTYEIILADAIARYKRAEGYDVYFQTEPTSTVRRFRKRQRQQASPRRSMLIRYPARLRESGIS